MKSGYDIIKAPILTEKSYDYIAHHIYTFEVAKNANKVESVHTVNKLGKIKRQGRYEGRTASKKKAYVKLTADSKGIELFDGIAQ